MSESRTDAESALDLAWFTAIDSLIMDAEFAETSDARTRAASKIIDYCIAMGQSINAPFLPTEKRPQETDNDDS